MKPPIASTGRRTTGEHIRRVEEIARAFHEEYERRAPQHGYKTRKESAVPWEQVPSENRSLMRATVSALLTKGVIS